MNHWSKHRIVRLTVGICLVALPGALQACTACYGPSDSPMAQGMNWGIMSLLVVIGCVLGGIASFFVYLGRRASGHASPPAGDPSHSER